MTGCIVGLGYVRLPLALRFAQSGTTVIGLDIDQQKVDLINSGQSYIKHIPSERITSELQAGRLSASADFGQIKNAAAVIICVPTPLNKNREPDLSFIVETGRRIGPYLAKGGLVVLKSTTYPGTTDEDL
jgi:UDP-N-acetyl-D-glucosamine dehydrogenase